MSKRYVVWYSANGGPVTVDTIDGVGAEETENGSLHIRAADGHSTLFNATCWHGCYSKDPVRPMHPEDIGLTAEGRMP